MFFFSYIFKLVWLVQIRHLPAAQHVVNYFQEVLYGDLSVVEDERRCSRINPSGGVQSFQVFLEFRHFITSGHCYLVGAVFAYVGCNSR